jgi:hypothetical protein
MSHDRNYFDDTFIVLTNETEFRRRAVPKQEFGNEGKGTGRMATFGAVYGISAKAPEPLILE